MSGYPVDHLCDEAADKIERLIVGLDNARAELEYQNARLRVQAAEACDYLRRAGAPEAQREATLDEQAAALTKQWAETCARIQAERDIYRHALLRIAGLEGYAVGAEAKDIANATLRGKTP